MSFSHEIKEELMRHVPVRACCRKTILSTFLWMNGGRRVAEFSGAAMGRFLVLLLKRLGIEEWGMGISPRGKEHAGKLILGDRVRFNNPSLASAAACCRKSFLRAAFLCKGHAVSPQKGYHVEIRTTRKAQAEIVSRFWKHFGMRGGIYVRRKEWVAFLKGGEQVGRFLNLLGTDQLFLRFEEVRALKETKNEVRRRVNYESGNVKRMVAAAGRLNKLFSRLMKQERWQKLSPALRVAAEGRMKYPALSLVELARKLHVSKSALNHRFRRLEKIAARID